MADQVTIYNLEQENNIHDNDFVPVSDGNSTRKLNLSSNYLTVNLSNIASVENLDPDGAITLVDSFLKYINIEEEDSGFLLTKDTQYILKTGLYTVNKKLPGQDIGTVDPIPENEIDYSRDIKLDDNDIPVTFLGKELTKDGHSFNTIDELYSIDNINDFDQYVSSGDKQGVQVNDYVKVVSDSTKNSNTSYYLLVHFDSEHGTIDPLVSPQANNTTSWKYIGYPLSTEEEDAKTKYSRIKLNEILKDLSDSRAQYDLSDIAYDLRTGTTYTPNDDMTNPNVLNPTVSYTSSETIFTAIPDFVNSKLSQFDFDQFKYESYKDLKDLYKIGVANTKGNEPETVSGLYEYNYATDRGDSRFAHKTLNNLRPNGNEQLYDRTTDWGDNRFAHKALDNLKANSVENAEAYDSTKDYGTSRFARKNLNNLRSATYDILNNKVPSKISVSGDADKSFVVNDGFQFNLTNENNEVSLIWKEYTLSTVSTSANSLYTSYPYTKLNKTINFPNATPTIQGGIVNLNQTSRIQNSLTEIDGLDGSLTWDTIKSWTLTPTQQAYCEKAYYKKIVTSPDQDKGNIATLPTPYNGVVGDKYHQTSDNKDYYWNGASWIESSLEQIYTNNDSSKLVDSHIILTGYNIPYSANTWASLDNMPTTNGSVSDKIDQLTNRLENVGSYLGAVDITGLKYSGNNLINDNTAYYKIATVTKSATGSGYVNGDILSINTDVSGQVLYLKVDGNNLQILTEGALFTTSTKSNVAVRGGSGTGMTVNITTTNVTSNRLPRNTTENPNANINDYMTVRYDPLHNGVSARYIISSVNSGNFTWTFDIYLDKPERDFSTNKITHYELADNAVQGNNILNGTISENKLDFIIDGIKELSGTVDFDTIGYDSGTYGSGTYIIMASSVSNSPTANTNLNWSTTLLNRIDNTKWWVQQYVSGNYGYQIARNLTCPGVELMRCMNNGAWVSVTSTDYRNWSWNYAQYQ